MLILMGYSSYKKIKAVAKKFNLNSRFLSIFDSIAPVEPSAWLQETLDMAAIFPLMNEKTKAERIIAPILLEIGKAYSEYVTLFSGEEINISSIDDLSGECDFFFALHPPQPYMDAPIISLAEAKDEDMEWGTAQCAAQMYAASLYNKAEGRDLPIIYGCATDGIEWQFMRFENNTFYIHSKVFTDIKEILGVWHYILQSYLP
jgi:hypothetical protein